MPIPYQHPLLYEIFTRVWLHQLSQAASIPITLDSVPDAVLDRFAELGFDYLYLMGVWTLGTEGPHISRQHPDLRAEYDRALPGWTDDDVVGSPFAVARYEVNPSFGGDQALFSLRQRLLQRNIKLILDFVPNHLARDHHWVTEKPQCFVHEADGSLACGKDPYFPPWTDTAQLDLRLEVTRTALTETLLGIAQRCDGVRCDMAMLVLDDIFRHTWIGKKPVQDQPEAQGEFWAQAIDVVHDKHPEFRFIAEAYWDLEWRLQMLGFDYTYDKSLYDRLNHASASSIRAHLGAASDYQRRSVRFVENHDEPRVAAVLPPDRRKAATFIAATVPGMRFFHQGQIEGYKERVPVQLARAIDETPDRRSIDFHQWLFSILQRPVMKMGSFALLATSGHGSEAFVAYRWDVIHPRGVDNLTDVPLVAVINFAPSKGSCRVTLDIAGIAGRRVRLIDLLTGIDYLRNGDELLDPARGLGVILPAYGIHLFEVRLARENGE